MKSYIVREPSMDTRAGIRRAGFLLEGEKQWAIGADFGIEGKQADRTGGRVDEESGLSFNLLVGIAAVETEHWRVVPLGLVGAINPTHPLVPVALGRVPTPFEHLCRGRPAPG